VPHNGSFALSCATPACVPPDCVVGAAADGNLGMPDNVTVTLNGQQFSQAPTLTLTLTLALAPTLALTLPQPLALALTLALAPSPSP
jgi:hypothetical protein